VYSGASTLERTRWAFERAEDTAGSHSNDSTRVASRRES
jgi:hypothetical protein